MAAWMLSQILTPTASIHTRRGADLFPPPPIFLGSCWRSCWQPPGRTDGHHWLRQPLSTRDKSVSIGTRLTKLTLLTVKYPLILLKEGKRGEEIHKTRE